MIETWQAIGSILGGVAAISGVHLYILKLVVRGGMLELDKQHREWCNNRFVAKEMLEEMLKRYWPGREEA